MEEGEGWGVGLFVETEVTHCFVEVFGGSVVCLLLAKKPLHLGVTLVL